MAVPRVEEGFLLLYRNRRLAELLKATPPGLDLMRLQHRRLRDLAERVVQSRRPEGVQLNVAGRDSRRLFWDWTMSPLLGQQGEVVALLSVVEDVSRPLLAGRRMESAVDQRVPFKKSDRGQAAWRVYS